MQRFLRIALGVSALATAALPARAVVQLVGVDFAPRSGISMQITGYYDNLPKVGFVPLRIAIRNDSGSEHDWTFRFISQSGYGSQIRNEYVWTASVNGRAEAVFDVLVPLVAVGNARHTYPSLHVRVSGFGVRSSSAYYAANYKYTGNRHAPFAGFSSTLAIGSLGPLEQELTDSGVEFTGCRFDLDYLSPDWRAYLGFGTLWLTEQDWVEVSAAARVGILDWVSQGGRLMFCSQKAPTDQTLTRVGLPSGDAATRSHGLGFVKVIHWNGTQLEPTAAAKELLRDEIFTHGRQLDEGYQGSWSLRSLVPETGLNSPLIILAMIGFALVVGPVNLVVFAGKRRRHRLFLTTPLISIVASFGLVLIILIQDGIGGEGGRVALRYLMPGAHKELIIQEQISRTGVLLASRFDLADSDYLALVDLDQTQDKNRTRNLVRTRTSAEGDWFSSRSVQAQYLSRIVPSRARIELLSGEGEAPVLLSSLDQPLRDVVYIDDRGGYWYVASLPAGIRTPLARSSRDEFRRNWWETNVREPGMRVGGLADRLAYREGHVYGVAEKPAAALIKTHDGIRWKREHMVVVAPVPGGESAR